MLQLVAGWPGADLIRGSGTAYLLVNAAHILGIALLVGAILPLDLMIVTGRRAGAVAPFLVRSAGVGLAVALTTGLWLFSVDPPNYLGNRAFLIKLALIAAAVLNLAALHLGRGWRTFVAGGPATPVARTAALASAALWLSTLVAGRWIGFL
ncbi:DUF2214 domain-containing protein [Cereibacter azotoformans]|uniref:DUF2214 domain-containing protein n=1 Tax=Cereibacter sphaeroides (strain ATCC 17025 / ATH 2.4.3) TaxID=349102 RepID=A4WWK3_CERS5|nr:hypothetical protein [Cereibacter azotoformans]ULB10965.1 DUF2214 domain-containing protein [Cereibacter azotoformans]